jgi:hypothetical protein
MFDQILKHIPAQDPSGQPTDHVEFDADRMDSRLGDYAVHPFKRIET